MKHLTVIFSAMLLLAVCNCCTPTQYDLFGNIYGVVSDSETAEPVSGATVILSPGGKTKTTGNDGRFEFAELDAIQYTITVQQNNYQTNRKTVSVVAGESTEANISLTKKQ
ncbi:MAG: carboxypeptidase-like regulatory domain-containing protein [Prevotellaceae bacterium]|jgi:hypothetical protein|nr:carboxypeptidase-like regulatory domain-containing protein [Prevotellaceae bacterium]